MTNNKLTNKRDFSQIINLIQDARKRTFRKINTELVTLYYEVGKIVSGKVSEGSWGDKPVDELALYIKAKIPELNGFTRRGLYRMKQFYETYSAESECYKIWSETQEGKSSQIVSALPTQLQAPEDKEVKLVSALPTQNSEHDSLQNILTEITWTNHLEILSSAKHAEEKLFYLMLTAKERWSMRELRRQLKSSAFERTFLSDKKMSLPTTRLPKGVFKDRYILEFLNLPDEHSESDLQKAIITNLKKFILEIGKGFSYMGDEYRLEVGNEDYYLDLLFFNRDLQCLVAFELKIEKFKPEFLGKLNFYLEALDRDVKRDNENPSIGILLCKGKDDTVVEYSLARNMSPAVIADYESKLPDKKLLQAKVEEFSRLLEDKENE